MLCFAGYSCHHVIVQSCIHCVRLHDERGSWGHGASVSILRSGSCTFHLLHEVRVAHADDAESLPIFGGEHNIFPCNLAFVTLMEWIQVVCLCMVC